MNDLIICPLEDRFIDGILTVSLLSFPITWSKHSFENELDNNMARYLVALKDGVVVGFGGMWIIFDEAHITNIAVHPEYRGFYIGSSLLEGLMEICRLEGVLAMTLEVRKSNYIAQKLYLKYGFLQEGIRKAYYENNKEDAIIMWNRNI